MRDRRQDPGEVEVQAKAATPGVAPGKVARTDAMGPAQPAHDDAAPPATGREAAPAGAWEADAGLMDAMGIEETAAAGVSGPGEALPHGDRIQEAFGEHDVSGVRAHTDARAQGASAAIGAEAYATGNDVAFGGPPSLHTAAHEAAHVVQQRAGVQLLGGVGEAGDAYEQHADRVADAVVAGRSAAPILDEMTGGARGGGGVTVQRLVVQKFDRHHATGPAGRGPNTASRGAATETSSSYKTYAEITAGTVDDFLSYAQQQADWSMEITDSAQQAELRQLMTWLRAGDHRGTALGSFTVADVLAAANQAALDAYARARTNTPPSVPVNAAGSVTEARDWGVDLLELEAAVQKPVLHQIFTAEAFVELRSEPGRLTSFCTYVRTCAPLLHAHGGTEIASFIAFHAEVGDPTSFRDVQNVRNYHRFEARVLTTLRTNQAGNGANKPLCLVLHSAFDHNGAFHRDPEFTNVFANGTNHTIMIEGAESLDAISGLLPQIVEQHGRSEPDPNDATRTVKRIDQCMIAGHGSSQSIELAGTLATDASGAVQTNRQGNLVTDEDDLNLRSDPSRPETVEHAARTRQFMEQLMGLMSQDPSTPHGRIVFNACLTASNEIDPRRIPDGGTPEEQAEAMRQAIQDSPSLVTAMREIATDQGRAVDVRGGNGSFGTVGLIDAGGGLDIVADGTDPDGDGASRGVDPELTNPDKLAYVEHGTDPGGCMSAVAECWARDRATAIPAVQRRRANALGGDWDEKVIQAMYELVETRYATNGAGISLLAYVTDGFKHLALEDDARVWAIWNLQANEDWQVLHDRLSPHGDWTGQRFVPTVFFQGWMHRNAAKVTDFLAAVGAMTVRTARDFLHMQWLKANHWPTLVPATSGRPPDGGRLRLALRDVVDDAAAIHANTRGFLSSLVSSNAFVVDVDTPLDGLSDSDQMLRALGLHPSQQVGGSRPVDPAAPPPDANVDMDGDDVNESLVEPLSATGRVNASALYVRDQPSVRGRNQPGLLHQGDEVHIMGQFRNWYLLDHGGVRGYSYKQYIDLV